MKKITTKAELKAIIDKINWRSMKEIKKANRAMENYRKNRID